MVRALTAQGVSVDVATTRNDESTEPPGEPVKCDGSRYFFFSRQTSFYKVSLALRSWISNHVAEYDLLHIHALFSYASTAAAKIAQRRRVPYIVRPLGVLNEWGIAHRRPVLKRLSLRFVEGSILRNAAAIHFTSAAEQREAVATVPEIAERESFVVPLAIDSEVAGHSDSSRFLARFPQAKDRSIVLFLSRIDPKKGLELLLQAFAQVKRHIDDALLVLAGSGSDGHVRSLRTSTDRLGISSHILWTGNLSGYDKDAAFAAAKVFVLPSYSENFGIAAAEALAAGVPCILTDRVALTEYLRTNESALVVPCDSSAIAHAICRLLSEPETRARLAKRGKHLAAERFSLQSVGESLVAEYDKIRLRSRRDK